MKIVDVRATPNPNAVTFVVDRTITSPTSFLSSEGGDTHPLMGEVSELPEVEAVSIQGAWVTVRFFPEEVSNAREALRKVGGILRTWEDEHETEPSSGLLRTDSTDPRLPLIEEVLQQRVVPYLNSHGGSIEIHGLDEDVLLIRYIGACGGCPASTSATLGGIENVLQEEIDPGLTLRPV